jgi:signal transduction histidine kinase/ligand-binding sensor domain-containing protein
MGPRGSQVFGSALRMAFATAGLLFGIASTGFALEPSTALASYGRQAWVMENGLPQNTVQALLQTRDGFVWLGTEVGLVRFDGIGFQLFDRNTTPALPGNDVRCLLQTDDGALWIGTSDGLARWKDGAVTTFTTKDGLPGNRIDHLDPDGQGGIVVNRSTNFQNGRWFHFVTQFLALQSGVRAEFQAHLAGGVTAVASNSLIELWRGNNQFARLAVGKELPGSRIQALFADREGSLWIGTNSGLARWAANKTQVLPVTDPLATASILSLMEDREGNLWVGTEADGLHILRDQRFRTIGAREGLSSDATTTVVEDAAGTLWVGTSGAGLNAIPENGTGFAAAAVKRYSVRNGLLSDVILSLAASQNGDLWVGTPDGLNRIRTGAVTSFTSADGLPDDFIRSLLVDADGSLWIGTRRGLTHWPGATTSAGGNPSIAKMETFTETNGLGSDLVGAMARDAKGDLWVATLAGLSLLGPGKGGKIENYTTANGLSSNVITALLPRRNMTLLVGTQDHGWNLWDGRNFIAAGSGTSGLHEASVHAMLDDESQSREGAHVWFATGNGLARGDCPEMPGGTPGVEPGNCSRWMEFGPADGLRSRETATNSHPSAWRSRDGHLWFATPRGLVEVDPAHFPVNNVPPGVELERFAIDDVPQPLRGAASVVQIPAGHVHFEFDYAGLSFVAPQKVRYRYMLEGVDHGWTEAGARRTAYYTNIPPGRHTFRVQAANNDGVWNMDGAVLTFELRPHFYQTLWFYALLILALVGLVILMQRLRLKRAEREFNAVLGERNRIAREIHDTLAQGYVGISVQLEVLAELLRLSKDEAAAKQLDLTRGYVREGLADARQSIWALRSQDSGETTLPVKLRRMVETEGNHGLESICSIFGAYRPLPPGTEQEILRVAQEAIHNVRKHAGARKLSVQLDYGPQEIALEVRDDGQGFAPDEAPAPGHYGLTGMHERAAIIGGKLEVASEPGAGTTVRLRVPARREAQASMKEKQ